MAGNRDPINIAEYANIRIAICPLGEIAGNYKLIKRKRWIFINDNIPMDSPMFKVIIAHELGHAPVSYTHLDVYKRQRLP